MELLAIDIDESRNLHFESEDCLAILKVYSQYYKKIGYRQPWIGYFAAVDGEGIVGCSGYKGMPKDSRVEIAYGTFKGFESRGIATEICGLLIQLSLRTDPSIRIMARTLTDNHPSMAVLKKNNFECLGLVKDDEDGEVFEWEFARKSHNPHH